MIRAPERLYFKSDGSTLVREGDAAAVTLYCKRGDIISDADVSTYKTYFEAFGWLPLEADKEAAMSIVSAHIRHDDATGSVTIEIPPRSVIQDIYVRCTEDAAGGPDIDFGELIGDSDGILDGLGQSGICDTVAVAMDTTANFKGRGALISVFNEDSQRIKTRKFYLSGMTLTNTCNSAGTAGEWDIHVMYVILPEVEKS